MRDLLKHIPVPDGRDDAWRGTRLPPAYHDLKARPGPAWFVDGGNAEVLGAPHYSLQLLRAAAVHVPDKRLRKRERTVLIRKAPVGWEIIGEDGARSFLPAQELGEAVTHARQALEHELCDACRADGELVVMDGDVAPPGCVALQKTTTVLTERGFPLPSVLSADGPWYAPLGRQHAVKLDRHARHVFLVHGATPEQLGVLMHYSRDSAFPGYPWGLVLADRLARVSKEEAQGLRVHARSMLRELTRSVASAEAAVDSHSILDSQ